MKRFRGFRMGACLCLPLLLCAAGCVSFDPAEARRAQTEGFTNELARLEAEWLAGPLSQICTLGSLAVELGDPVLDFDPPTKRFTANGRANAMLSGEAPRTGWEEYYRL